MYWRLQAYIGTHRTNNRDSDSDNVLLKEHEKSHDNAECGGVDFETEINPLLQELFKWGLVKEIFYGIKKLEYWSYMTKKNLQVFVRCVSICEFSIQCYYCQKWYHFDCAGRENTFTHYERSGKVKKWKCFKYSLDCKV